MSFDTRINWQALMTATIIPPPESFRHFERRLKRRQPRLRLPSCECPEFCPIDHEND